VRRLLTLLLPACLPAERTEKLATAPAVAAGDSGYLVVWEDLERYTTGDLISSTIVAKRVALDGTVGDTIEVTSTGLDPMVGWDGTQWLVISRGQLTRIDGSGAIVGTTAVPMLATTSESRSMTRACSRVATRAFRSTSKARPTPARAVRRW
jgi:hypothetical protein